MTWKDEQHFELNWHGNCVNSFWEETKQQVYAKRMGLKADMVLGKYPVYDLKGISVLDIGGGPVSMLLKCVNLGNVMVIDPCNYPKWIDARYEEAKIQYKRIKGEDLFAGNKEDTRYVGENAMFFDEVWIYNVLQHVDDPKLIIENARKVSKIIRIFEWIDNGVSLGHPHDLKENLLNEWLGGIGHVEHLNESGCHGKAYYGLFKGNKYDK